jgi:hypothetical protein
MCFNVGSRTLKNYRFSMFTFKFLPVKPIKPMTPTKPVKPTVARHSIGLSSRVFEPNYPVPQAIARPFESRLKSLV